MTVFPTCGSVCKLFHDMKPWMFLVSGAAIIFHGIALRQAFTRGQEMANGALRVEAHPPRARARLLLLGDSTGVGVGSETGGASLAGLLARDFPRVEIFNECSNGAKVVDLLDQLHAHSSSKRPFDLVLVLAGGNDVLKLTDPLLLGQQATLFLQKLRPQALHVVWMGSADIGRAPALMPPLSWAFGWLCRRAMRSLEEAVRREGAEFINFCGTEHNRVFSTAPERYFARDGLHPSAAGYRHCFDELKRHAPLHSVLRVLPPMATNRAAAHTAPTSSKQRTCASV